MGKWEPPLEHFWEPEGTGEWSSRWLNPVCDRSVRRHISDWPTMQQAASRLTPERCDLCVDIVALRAS